MSGPLVIGGVGGSGTRMVAEIVSKLGFDLGTDTNVSGDNLWFTLLFKRPVWYQNVLSNDNNVFRDGMGLITKAMTGSGRPALSELMFLSRAVFEISALRRDPGPDLQWKPLLHAQRLLAAAYKPGQNSKRSGWGWKEPNSHVYLKHIGHYFDQYKYIHTMRHGVDMAFSQNQNQLYTWGANYGVEIPDSASRIPAASLKYWVRANDRVFRFFASNPPGQFHTVNYHNLCQSPREEIDKLLQFLDLKPENAVYRNVLSIPGKSKPVSPCLRDDLALFDSADIEKTRSFGFRV